MGTQAFSDELAHSLSLRASPLGALWTAEQSALEGQFLYMVALGRIPGLIGFAMQAHNDDIDAAVETVWEGPNNYVFPDPVGGGDQWEAVSTDAQDNIAGSGSFLLQLNYLDINYAKQFTTIILNGTTPVTTTPTDILRLRSFFILPPPAGSNNAHAGIITLRIAGGGAVQTVLPLGINNSRHGFYTVPLGFTGLPISRGASVQKNKDIDLLIQGTLGSNKVFYSTGVLSLYQSAQRDTLIMPQPLPEKSDLIFSASSSNPDSSVTATLQILEVLNG